jgi:hypothetical protein
MASSTSAFLARLVPDATDTLSARQKPDPDRIPRVLQAAAYRDRTYYCIAALVALVSIFNWTSRFLQSRPSSLRGSPRARGVISITRLPAASMNASRALAFRQTLRIGNLYTINAAEVLFTSAYIILVFTWSLINCTSFNLLNVTMLQSDRCRFSYEPGRNALRSKILGKYGGKYRFHAAIIYGSPWNEKQHNFLYVILHPLNCIHLRTNRPSSPHWRKLR